MPSNLAFASVTALLLRDAAPWANWEFLRQAVDWRRRLTVLVGPDTGVAEQARAIVARPGPVIATGPPELSAGS
ncbi:hypothetical protein [Nocardia carnea]|uniref:hypothetical protein n=1 Tax=Nocardia carnea TaxID=37328 RepID=UPI0024562818|nr:hypothetical protein [Nocardia carnea]